MLSAGQPGDSAKTFINPFTIGFMRLTPYLIQLVIALGLHHLTIACASLLADANARTIRVDGGGDLVSANELDRLKYIASGNSSAAMHNFLGLPSCSSESTEYYPVLTTGDPAWIGVAYSGNSYSSWGFVLRDPCTS
jgi:hypothetical protein